MKIIRDKQLKEEIGERAELKKNQNKNEKIEVPLKEIEVTKINLEVGGAVTKENINKENKKNDVQIKESDANNEIEEDKKEKSNKNANVVNNKPEEVKKEEVIEKEKEQNIKTQEKDIKVINTQEKRIAKLQRNRRR